MKLIIDTALHIKATSGVLCAATYLREKGFCLSAARDVLLIPATRHYYING